MFVLSSFRCEKQKNVFPAEALRRRERQKTKNDFLCASARYTKLDSYKKFELDFTFNVELMGTLHRITCFS